MPDACQVYLYIVQNWQGAVAGGLVGSELAAMMDHAILEELQEIYIANGTFASERKAVAKLINKPEHLVDICFFVAIDNDRRHSYPRRVMLEPRYTQEQCDLKMTQQKNHILAEEWAQGGGEGGVVAACGRAAERAAGFGATMSEYVRMKWAEADPRARVLHAEQYQPLPKQTPELNMPAEHCVHTLKGGVADMLHQPGVVHSDDLRNARAYHQMVERLTQERFGKGPRQHDIACSVRKMLCTAEILAAPKGAKVVVTHRFRDSAEAQKYEVTGTGGGWIPIPRWS